VAFDSFNRLKEAVDQTLVDNPLKQLQQRTWLLHWALFIFWNIPEGYSQLVELFLQDRFTVAIQVNAPHLLRYALRLVSIPVILSLTTYGQSCTDL
jgi:translation initiation factor 3 subunit E